MANEWALLVGVTHYPALSGVDLQGPANDVRLMRQTLSRLGLPADNVVTLAEAEGPDRWPTREHILAQLNRLSRVVAPGDWALVYLSGHGAQLPQTALTRARYPEPDGMDEAFLTRDTQLWDPKRQQVQGALLDDDIGLALSAIEKRGASVWAIFDTCHAGDMWRNAGPADQAPIWRYVSPPQLQVPAAALRQAAAASARASRHQPATAKTTSPVGGQTVGFFAAQKDEGAAEEWLPDPDQPGRKARFGVFTHSLHRLTRDWRGSFSALARALASDYEQARPFPTPRFTGPLELRPPFLRAPAQALN
jgi:hypothetical protein